MLSCAWGELQVEDKIAAIAEIERSSGSFVVRGGVVTRPVDAASCAADSTHRLNDVEENNGEVAGY